MKKSIKTFAEKGDLLFTFRIIVYYNSKQENKKGRSRNECDQIRNDDLSEKEPPHLCGSPFRFFFLNF